MYGPGSQQPPWGRSPWERPGGDSHVVTVPAACYFIFSYEELCAFVQHFHQTSKVMNFQDYDSCLYHVNCGLVSYNMNNVIVFVRFLSIALLYYQVILRWL